MLESSSGAAAALFEPSRYWSGAQASLLPVPAQHQCAGCVHGAALFPSWWQTNLARCSLHAKLGSAAVFASIEKTRSGVSLTEGTWTNCCFYCA